MAQRFRFSGIGRFASVGANGSVSVLSRKLRAVRSGGPQVDRGGTTDNAMRALRRRAGDIKCYISAQRDGTSTIRIRLNATLGRVEAACAGYLNAITRRRGWREYRQFQGRRHHRLCLPEYHLQRVERLRRRQD